MVWNMWFLRGNRARSYAVKFLSARLWRDFAAEFFIFAAECHPKVRICAICVRIYAIVEEEVLVVFPAADVEPAESFHALRDSGLQLYGLHQVGLAEDDGHVQQFLRPQRVQTHLQALGVGFLYVRCDDSLPECAAREGIILSRCLPGCRKCGAGQCRGCP